MEWPLVEVVPGHLATSNGITGEVSIWDLNRPNADPVLLPEDANGVSNIVPLPDERVVLFDSPSGQVEIRDPLRPEFDVEVLGSPDITLAVSMLSDGRIATLNNAGELNIFQVGFWDRQPDS